MSERPDPLEAVKKILSQHGLASSLLKRVRFGGIVGKLALLGITAFFILGIIALRLPAEQLLWLVLVVLVILALAGGGILFYGMRHPDYATLEGTEIVMLRQQALYGSSDKVINENTLESLDRVSNPLSNRDETKG